jgi:hypothetical protein
MMFYWADKTAHLQTPNALNAHADQAANCA